MDRAGDRIRSNGLGDVLGGRFGILLVALVGIFIYWQANQKDVPFAPGRATRCCAPTKRVAAAMRAR
jgi:hypothetical protein